MGFKATKNDVVLSGHGSVELGTGETTVPGGFELVVLAPPGASITDRLGGMVERGKKVKGLKLSTGSSGWIPFEPKVYKAGRACPNFVLYAPTGLTLRPGVPHMLGVSQPTPLSDLWQRVSLFRRNGKTTRVYWCACASITSGVKHCVDAS